MARLRPFHDRGAHSKRAVLSHSPSAGAQTMQQTQHALNTTWKDYHGNSPSHALLDQLVASRADMFVGTHASSFTQYVGTLRLATRRASPRDTKFCCRRSTFFAAWQPLNWSQVVQATHKPCRKGNASRGQQWLDKGCANRFVRPSAEVVRHLLLMPLPLPL